MSEPTPSNEQIGSLIIAEQAAQLMQATSKVHLNLGQDILVTTEDKIWRILANHLASVERRRAWTTPLGILLAILVVFPTTSFRQFLFPAETWQAFFLMCAAGSFYWLARSLWQAGDRGSVTAIFKSVLQPKGATVDDVVAEIKRTAIGSEKAGDLITAEEAGVILRDRFDGFSDWRQYGVGSVSQSNEITPYSGTFCLKKDGANDPNGGFRELGRQTGVGLVLAGWIWSPQSRAGGMCDRLALENSGFDGYGFAVDHSSNKVCIERRDNGFAAAIGETVSFTPPSGQWYRFKFHIKIGGGLLLMLYGRSGEELLRTPEVLDDKHTSFDRVVVHGGFTYYVDDLKIARYQG